jgi:hypothetical protein
MISISNAIAVSLVDFLNGKLNEGSGDDAMLRIYSGGKPNFPEIAPSGTLLAEFILPNPVFFAATSIAGAGQAEARVSEIDDALILATGTAGWFRALNRNGVAALDGTVTLAAGSGDMKLMEINLISGRKVNINSWIVRFPQ